MIHDSVDDYNNPPTWLGESLFHRGYSSAPITGRLSSTDDNARFCPLRPLGLWCEDYSRIGLGRQCGSLLVGKTDQHILSLGWAGDPGADSEAGPRCLSRLGRGAGAIEMRNIRSISKVSSKKASLLIHSKINRCHGHSLLHRY